MLWAWGLVRWDHEVPRASGARAALSWLLITAGAGAILVGCGLGFVVIGRDAWVREHGATAIAIVDRTPCPRCDAHVTFHVDGRAFDGTLPGGPRNQGDRAPIKHDTNAPTSWIVLADGDLLKGASGKGIIAVLVGAWFGCGGGGGLAFGLSIRSGKPFGIVRPLLMTAGLTVLAVAAAVAVKVPPT